MQLPMFATSWHGLDLLQFPAAKDALDKPAGPEFYDQFYGELAKHPVSPDFIKGKASFGHVSLREFIKPWREKAGREPRILSLGVGKGYIEEAWLAADLDVTLQECQIHSLTEILARYPKAKGIVGDAATMDFGGPFDIVGAFGLDCCLGEERLRQLFSNARKSMSSDGIFVLNSVTVLSMRQIAAESVKAVLRTRHRKPHVFWGWWRSVGKLCAVAGEAGLETREVFRFPKTGGSEGRLIRRPSFMRRWMTFRDFMITATFSPA